MGAVPPQMEITHKKKLKIKKLLNIHTKKFSSIQIPQKTQRCKARDTAKETLLFYQNLPRPRNRN